MIETSNIRTERLENGLRVLYIPLKESAIEYTGVTVKTGSRNDPKGLEGLAHFVEHTIFKGTGRRRSWHIINRMEAVGGELNAYTTKETTVVYSLFPTGNFRRAADLISDLITDSRFPTNEIEREREVVDEEISSYLDMPSEAVFDDFDDLLFEGCPLGHNILGSREALRRMTSGDCRNWLETYYTADNMVMFYAGPLPLSQVVKTVERYFGKLRPSAQGCIALPSKPTDRVFAEVKNYDNHQAHTVIGCALPDMFWEGRYAMALLSNILGGPGMNSLLNVNLRERRGLVYSVDSSVSLMSDCGLFAVYYGCDPSDNDRCRRLVESTIAKLCESPLTQRQLDQAKRQYLGQLAVAGENTENIVLALARALLYRDEIIPDEVVREKILSISADDLLEVAGRIAPSKLSRLSLI